MQQRNHACRYLAMLVLMASMQTLAAYVPPGAKKVVYDKIVVLPKNTCTEQSVFGQAIGSQALSGGARSVGRFGAGEQYVFDSGWQPFTWFEAIRAPQSKKIWEANGSAYYSTHDLAIAARDGAIENFKANLNIADVSPDPKSDRVSLFTRPLVLSGNNRVANTGLWITLDVDDTELSIECSDVQSMIKEMHFNAPEAYPAR
jgi:hypothetical protein